MNGRFVASERVSSRLCGSVLGSDGERVCLGRQAERSNAIAVVDVIGWSQVTRVIGDDQDPYEAFADRLVRLVSRSSKLAFDSVSRSLLPRTLSIPMDGKSCIEVPCSYRILVSLP